MFRIVQECLTNIHRYSGASKARIVLHVRGDKLHVEVADDGKGIASSDVAFTSETRASLGVGIPGMRERVQELGGMFKIESDRHGTRVLATIPIAEPRSHDGDLPADLVALEPKRAHHGKHPGALAPRILIVDDHELLRRGVRTLIENETDLEVCGEAANAAEAVKLAKQLRPDLVLLDLQLPDSSGWEFVRAVRRFPFWTKILVFSTFSYEQVGQAAGHAKCEGYVSKSRASTDLIQAVRAVLGGSTFYPTDGEDHSRAATA